MPLEACPHGEHSESCRRCKQAGNTARYRERHREEILARERAAATTPEGREKGRAKAARRRAATPEAYILAGLKQRCRDAAHKSYADYGGRGITVSAVFDGDGGLARFIAEVGRRPSPRHAIERIENELGYEPGNLCWATAEDQQRNKRSNRMLTFRGETLCLVEWSERLGISDELIRARIDRLGWTVEEALTRPAKGRVA